MPLGSPPVPETSGDDAFDLLFVGAGVSTSYTLLYLLEQLREAPPRALLRVGIVERSTGLFGGVPYDHRSSHTALLITSLRDFLPEPECSRFSAWLTQNKVRAFEPLRAGIGRRSSAWLVTHRDAIERDDWHDLYLPRYLFGMYMRERVEQALVEADDLVALETVHDDAVELRAQGSTFHLGLARRDVGLRARRVVLAVGAPPNKPRLASATGPVTDPGVVLIEDPYEPGLASLLERVTTVVRERGAAGTDVLLIGGNATTMDVLYALVDHVDDGTLRFQVLAPSGELPERFDRPSQPSSFAPDALMALPVDGTTSAHDVFVAACADIERGKVRGHSIADTLAPISEAVGRAVQHLPLEEKRSFVDCWGVRIGRMQRRAGAEYSDVAQRLRREGRLSIVTGRYRAITSVEAGGIGIEHEADGVVSELETRPAVVINCAGFFRLDELPDRTLLRRLVDGGLGHIAPARTGLLVDDAYQCHPDLFVIGPLLAGNVIGGTPVWHMEHCGRISTVSRSLAGVLAHRIAGSATAALD